MGEDCRNCKHTNVSTCKCEQMENEFLQMLSKNYVNNDGRTHVYRRPRWHSGQNLVQLVHFDPAMTWSLTVVAVLMLRFTWLLLPDHVFHQVNDPFTRSRTRICATRELQAPHAGLSIKWHEQTIIAITANSPSSVVCLEFTTTTISLLFIRSFARWLAHLILIGILHQISNMLITACKPS